MRLRLFMLGVGFFIVTVSCSGPAPEAPKPATKKAVTAKAEPDEAESIEAQRKVFGVPLPPQIIRIDKYPAYARAETKLKLPEVKSFYEDKLVDYDISEHKRLIKWVGLRDFLPEIQAAQRVWKGPTVVTIRRRDSTMNLAAKPPIPPKNPPKVEIIIGGRDDPSAPRTKPPKYAKGQPVDLRTPDGELLAPGARWGEPYTPPKGSPMDRPRYKSHFGKPFGSWTLQ